MRQDEVIEAIRRCFLFSDADARIVTRVAAASRVITYRAGEMLFACGDPADGLRLVLSGLVRIWISNTEGKELTLSLLEPGDPLGEIALLDGLPRTANATQIETGGCLFVPRPIVDRLLQEDPAFGRHVVQLLCETLRRNTDSLGGFAFQGLDTRLARVLFDLATAHGTAIRGSNALRLTRKFSQTDLGQMLGVTREAVNKRLMLLIHDGLVRMADGHIVVTDLEELQARSAGAAPV